MARPSRSPSIEAAFSRRLPNKNIACQEGGTHGISSYSQRVPSSPDNSASIALYESNGFLFELYDGGQPYQPIVIRWERLQPVIRKDAIETDEKEWSRKILRTDQMKMTDFLNTLRECFHQELAAKTGWGREELKAAFERAISNAVAPRTNIE